MDQIGLSISRYQWCNGRLKGLELFHTGRSVLVCHLLGSVCPVTKTITVNKLMGLKQYSTHKYSHTYNPNSKKVGMQSKTWDDLLSLLTNIQLKTVQRSYI